MITQDQMEIIARGVANKIVTVGTKSEGSPHRISRIHTFFMLVSIELRKRMSSINEENRKLKGVHKGD